MVTNRKKHSSKRCVKQASNEVHSDLNKIGASTPYDFTAKNLTPYGGLLPVATMLEKIGFRKHVEDAVTVERATRVMSTYQFVLAIVLGIYLGFTRLNQLRFIARDPLLAGIVKVPHLPPQCTLWRFLDSLHVGIARQIQSVQRRMREAVWAAGNIALKSVTIDTDTTVHTLYGKQMGARKSYNPKNKGKKSYQPIMSFLAETREFVAGELRNGDRPTGKQIARHLQEAFQSLPSSVTEIYARADAGFYCSEAVETYEKFKCRFVIVARKTARLLEELVAAEWKPSPHTETNEQCEFWYQPKGWGKTYRFIAFRYEKDPDADEEPEDAVQYQLFATKQYKYRVFVTNMTEPIDKVEWFYNQRAAAENLIKESNNDAGLAAHPSRLFVTNQNHFQLAMLAYNLNAWLMLFNRDATDTTQSLKHTTLATARLRFLFIAAKIWHHSGRTGVSFSEHYEEQSVFMRLMERLKAIKLRGDTFDPVVETALG
ncbi:MAG: IS1380 family transposase [Acidobacteriota bacterium]